MSAVLPGTTEPAPGAELAALHAQIEAARAELAGLRREIAVARAQLAATPASRLVEINEHLVVAALRAQSDAEKAASALEVASRSAEFDALTELPNRLLLHDRLATALAHAKRNQGRLALLFLDLNHFKEINDTLGHGVGDQVLKLAAERLTGAVREVDTVSRLGGDEFVIVLVGVSQAADAVLIAKKIIAALGVPLVLAGHVLRLTASIGISLYPDDGVDADVLIDRADAAMYQAKRQGLGSLVFHGGSPLPATSPEPLALAALTRPVMHVETVLANQERRNAELREANEQLVLMTLGALELQAAAERAQRQQSEFLAIVAHELRNPIGPVRFAAAQLGLIDAEEPKLQRAQAIIERQVEHLSRLIDDLLDVSRVGTGTLRLMRAPVDLRGVIDDAALASRAAMDLRLQHFSVQLPAALPAIDGDVLRLTQVIGNLLDNASKYTREGGTIALSATVESSCVVVSVADNGIGMSPDALGSVFQLFVQERHAVGVDGAGLGIGLMVVRALVEAHGGSVVATSPGVGLGSRFVVRLPIDAPAPG
ncbi:diguanylate cyclase domain-containing protein [Piscinibacter koreensis]|uniref:histidine kinase n=1 Tax=Piscinibacter koreensis TaxID=2742824 RepID=A0A7Y6NN47_9BURK|nr:diguanylate cyclase [Schlegelella koreensis]